MEKRLNTLILEDRPEDIELLEREIKKLELPVVTHSVKTREEFLQALKNFPSIDLFLLDYALGSFTGLDAMKLAKERFPDAMYIIVSGTIGAERTVYIMEAGAADFILKDQLVRLVPAIKHAQQEFEERRLRKKAEQELLAKAQELERLNKLMIGREVKMAEMKKELEELRKKAK